MVGHSQGEVAAGCVAGVLSLVEGARIVVGRSRLLVGLAGGGGMVAVGAGEGAVREWLSEGVGVAAVNGPESVVVSGPVGELRAFVERCAGAGVSARWLPVDYASPYAATWTCCPPRACRRHAGQAPTGDQAAGQTGRDCRTKGCPAVSGHPRRRPQGAGQRRAVHRERRRCSCRARIRVRPVQRAVHQPTVPRLPGRGPVPTQAGHYGSVRHHRPPPRRGRSVRPPGSHALRRDSLPRSRTSLPLVRTGRDVPQGRSDRRLPARGPCLLSPPANPDRRLRSTDPLGHRA
ncbi:acyltransferase domain-containing protein [Nocardia wallacei]|uniref:acyltransferase domain-containing protein n=1 Tax=Nocardia wallacei TaxID=480035 RepID=UPI003CC80050